MFFFFTDWTISYNRHWIEYSAEYSNYSKINFSLRKNKPIIPIPKLNSIWQMIILKLIQSLSPIFHTGLRLSKADLPCSSIQHYKVNQLVELGFCWTDHRKGSILIHVNHLILFYFYISMNNLIFDSTSYEQRYTYLHEKTLGASKKSLLS
jgi:hypothetical protein